MKKRKGILNTGWDEKKIIKKKKKKKEMR